MVGRRLEYDGLWRSLRTSPVVRPKKRTNEHHKPVRSYVRALSTTNAYMLYIINKKKSAIKQTKQEGNMPTHKQGSWQKINKECVLERNNLRATT